MGSLVAIGVAGIAVGIMVGNEDVAIGIIIVGTAGVRTPHAHKKDKANVEQMYKRCNCCRFINPAPFLIYETASIIMGGDTLSSPAPTLLLF